MSTQPSEKLVAEVVLVLEIEVCVWRLVAVALQSLCHTYRPDSFLLLLLVLHSPHLRPQLSLLCPLIFLPLFYLTLSPHPLPTLSTPPLHLDLRGVYSNVLAFFTSALLVFYSFFFSLKTLFPSLLHPLSLSPLCLQFSPSSNNSFFLPLCICLHISSYYHFLSHSLFSFSLPSPPPQHISHVISCPLFLTFKGGGGFQSYLRVWVAIISRDMSKSLLCSSLGCYHIKIHVSDNLTCEPRLLSYKETYPSPSYV